LALLNKADKVKRGAAMRALAAVRDELPAGAQALLFSAATGLGADAATAILGERLRNISEPLMTAPVTDNPASDAEERQ